MIAAQFCHPASGAVYMAWYLPLRLKRAEVIGLFAIRVRGVRDGTYSLERRFSPPGFPVIFSSSSHARMPLCRPETTARNTAQLFVAAVSARCAGSQGISFRELDE
jgi:hypothetical protein